jgi:GTP cyclohydrolase II
MKRAAQVEMLRRVVSTRMPTRWGTFQTLGFERKLSNGSARVETALAIVMGDVTQGTALLRIHSQCFTSEVLGSLRCDCREQLEKLFPASFKRFTLELDAFSRSSVATNVNAEYAG